MGDTIKRFNRDRAVRALIDAIELGDRKAAERSGLSERTIRNYKTRLKKDSQFASSFRDLATFRNVQGTHEQARVDATWREQNRAAIGTMLDATKTLTARAVELGKVSDDPKAVAVLLDSVAGALDRVMQVELVFQLAVVESTLAEGPRVVADDGAQQSYELDELDCEIGSAQFAGPIPTDNASDLAERVRVQNPSPLEDAQ